MPTKKHLLISTDRAKISFAYEQAVIDPEESSSDPSHIHNEVEIYLKVSGDISFLVRNSIYPISRGDVIVTRAGELHHCIYHSQRLHEHFCLWVSEADGGELLSFLSEYEANFIHLPEEEREELIQSFYRLREAEEGEDRLAASAEILGILSALRKGMARGQAEARESVPRELQGILDYIQKNYSEIASVSELTSVFFISPSTMNRWFGHYLHMTPKAYLESVKLSGAQRLLREGRSVTDVCFICGYCDSSHFIRAFKRKFHVTPGQFRASNLS